MISVVVTGKITDLKVDTQTETVEFEFTYKLWVDGKPWDYAVRCYTKPYLFKTAQRLCRVGSYIGVTSETAMPVLHQGTGEPILYIVAQSLFLL